MFLILYQEFESILVWCHMAVCSLYPYVTREVLMNVIMNLPYVGRPRYRCEPWHSLNVHDLHNGEAWGVIIACMQIHSISVCIISINIRGYKCWLYIAVLSIVWYCDLMTRTSGARFMTSISDSCNRQLVTQWSFVQHCSLHCNILDNDWELLF